MTDSPAIDGRLQHQWLAFARLIMAIPANIVGISLPAKLGLPECQRLLMALPTLGGRAVASDGRHITPFDHQSILSKDSQIFWENRSLPVRSVILHRSVLLSFHHFLLLGDAFVLLIAAESSPLLDQSGLRFLNKHFQHIQKDPSAILAFHQELEALASLLKQGNPFEQMNN